MTTPANTNPPKARVGMTDPEIDRFIQSRGGLLFPDISFRRDTGAKFSTPFGIDTSTPEVCPIRIHLGTDRRSGQYGQVYAPFEGTFHIEESSDYGTLFRLQVANEFEVRVGHMKLQNIAVRNRTDARIKAGELIGLAGSEGKSAGVHTHTEVVSLLGESVLCETILKAKGLERDFYTPDELKALAGPLWPQLKDDMTRKGVLAVSPYKIQKLDRWTGMVQIYYDSRALFGI